MVPQQVVERGIFEGKSGVGDDDRKSIQGRDRSAAMAAWQQTGKHARDAGMGCQNVQDKGRVRFGSRVNDRMVLVDGPGKAAPGYCGVNLILNLCHGGFRFAPGQFEVGLVVNREDCQ